MYGNIISNLHINGQPALYPIVNERSIRAAAGIMFLVGFFTFLTVFYTKNYTLMYIVVPIFWLDFFLKSVFQPHYSIFGFVADFLVKNQDPEYVGAIQKRFAWSIGLALATLMIIVGIVFNIRGWAPFTICFICLFFMWMETSLGICVGCKIYQYLIKKKVLKQPKYQPNCPGGVCNVK